jgi:hypothetical protein
VGRNNTKNRLKNELLERRNRKIDLKQRVKKKEHISILENKVLERRQRKTD